ncbi:MAG: hypothetical protein H6835_19320 [Planctomycetes bacterium]|nr:hypothetical protein [Planctomycetota bacterium]
MLTKVLFWLFAAADLAAIALVLLLGLAAAAPSRTSPLAVLLTMALPTAALAGAVLLHLRSRSPALQLLAYLLVSAPVVGLVIARVVAEARSTANPGGQYGETPLTRALRELPTDPGRIDAVRSLLGDGADPNEAGEQLPLTLAVFAARRAGATALDLLLDAGADPDAADAFGRPAWFAATGITVDPAVLQVLLARGADLAALARDGRGGVWSAVDAQNWPAALLLVEAGAPLGGRSPMGRSLEETLALQVASRGDADGAAAVLAAVRARR